MVRRILMLVAALALVAAACNDDGAVDDVDDVTNGDPEPAYDVADQPADAAATIVSPEDGDTVSSPVQVVLEATGIDILPAGAPTVGEGHFHLMVDVGCLPDGEVPPGPSEEAEAEGYYHLADGSSEIELELEPGAYELCVQFGDGIHHVFGDPDTIQITVE